jgi:hypothetical protein
MNGPMKLAAAVMEGRGKKPPPLASDFFETGGVATPPRPTENIAHTATTAIKQIVAAPPSNGWTSNNSLSELRDQMERDRLKANDVRKSIRDEAHSATKAVAEQLQEVETQIQQLTTITCQQQTNFNQRFVDFETTLQSSMQMMATQIASLSACIGQHHLQPLEAPAPNDENLTLDPTLVTLPHGKAGPGKGKKNKTGLRPID